MKCPSCGYLLGNRQIIYEKGLREIMNNPNANEEEKLLLRIKLVESLNIKNYCCRMRVITFKQVTEIIK
jgi:DNA-directed RNA polymerase subunit N (RpoN/RPB10)